MLRAIMKSDYRMLRFLYLRGYDDGRDQKHVVLHGGANIIPRRNLEERRGEERGIPRFEVRGEGFRVRGSLSG